MCTSDVRYEHDLRRLIAIARTIFSSMEKVLKARNIDIQHRIRMLKCYVWATLLYPCETLTLDGDIMKQLESVEMWFLRQIIRISWTDKFPIEEVLHKQMSTENC